MGKTLGSNITSETIQRSTMLGSSLAPMMVTSNSSKMYLTNRTFRMMASIKGRPLYKTMPMTLKTMVVKAFRTTLNNTMRASKMTKRGAKARKTKVNLST